jgi:putative membrane protein
MFIDYVPLMLINMVAGLVLLAGYVWRGLDEGDGRRWAAGFMAAGLVAFLTGLHMIYTWPLPKMYNITHGELSVFFGIIFLAAALAVAKGWDLLPVAIYAFFGGLGAVVIGIRVVDLGLTLTPKLSGIGYILTGLAGVFSAPVFVYRKSRLLRRLAIVVLLVAAAVWALVGYGAYWDHLKSMNGWTPAPMRTASKA